MENTNSLEKIATVLEAAANEIDQKQQIIDGQIAEIATLKESVSEIQGKADELQKVASEFEGMSMVGFDEMGAPGDDIFPEKETGSDLLDSFLAG